MTKSDELLYEMAMKGHDYVRVAEFVQWIIDLDTPGNLDRRSVTLNKIIQKAKATRIAEQP